MFSRSKKVLLIVSVLLVALLVFAGAALAQDTAPEASGSEGLTPLQQMQEWMGPEGWGTMIQHMTRIHGAEATGAMLQEMNETGSCHGSGFLGNWGEMMGNWNGAGGWRGMMRGFGGMGGGMMSQ
jgi:hypothetical protein